MNILRIFTDLILRSLNNAIADKLEIPNFLDFSRALMFLTKHFYTVFQGSKPDASEGLDSKSAAPAILNYRLQ